MTSPTTTLSGLGPVRQTYARTEDFPKTPRAFALVSQEVRSAGLLARAYWFYGIVAAALVLAFAGSVTGMILLGGSWFQLLIAGAAGILFTQVAFSRMRQRTARSSRRDLQTTCLHESLRQASSASATPGGIPSTPATTRTPTVWAKTPTSRSTRSRSSKRTQSRPVAFVASSPSARAGCSSRC